MDHKISPNPGKSTERIISEGDRKIAYFSMEIGIESSVPTYSGGLGVLAGDTIRSFADLSVPAIAVTLLYQKGYFYQKLDSDGHQTELPYQWNPSDTLELLPHKVSVIIENRPVLIQAWRYQIKGITGYSVPVLFLDTNLAENSEKDRHLTEFLYGGDERYRLCQEVVLGIGGVRFLQEANYTGITKYHMNEGHSSLLTIELLMEHRLRKQIDWDYNWVKRLCVFTTHTPVPAGMDQFSYDLVKEVLGDYIPLDILKQVGGQDRLNMTLLALNLSDYENGVAKEHGRVSRELFPGYSIDWITNGVHSSSWAGPGFTSLFDNYIHGWKNDPFSLRYALSIPKEEIWRAHETQKQKLIDFVNTKTAIKMDLSTLTIGFARRATAYKRADLIFHDIGRLRAISKDVGRIQLVFAGKAHPHDEPGKELIHKVVNMAKELGNDLPVVYLENYDISLAKLLISGVDLWLNNPRKPQEASGTSGMKAALNGIPSLSILDGWWIEGCIEGLTGWAIDSINDNNADDKVNASALYNKLEKEVIPRFYNNREDWLTMMRHTIAINASFFNTHRMVQQYVLNAYLD